MAPGRLAATLIPAAPVPGGAAAQTGEAPSAAAFVDTFHDACLAHLPDVAGHPAAFVALGFDGAAGQLRRDGGMRALNVTVGTGPR